MLPSTEILDGNLIACVCDFLLISSSSQTLLPCVPDESQLTLLKAFISIKVFTYITEKSNIVRLILEARREHVLFS